ncbi:MAG TPA: hypothetical protein VIK59_07200 [Verrucomicrobiae bacterium]
MKTKLILLVASALLLTLNSGFAQGVLTPPGPPAPTMKSLDQIEARTPITNTTTLVTITQSGSYYLTHNLTVVSGNGIDINASGVTLDLNGFTISSTSAGATGYGILINSGLSDLAIANGHIRGSVTNNGSGVYDGGGFDFGIYYSGNLPVNVLVSRVSVSGCQGYGIFLGGGNSTLVESCVVQTIGLAGINAAIVKSCSAMDCGNGGIDALQVSDSRGQCSGGGDAIYANYLAQNCYGQSSTGFGLYAGTALNCIGYSYGAGDGLYASATASGCYGYSSSGTGLSAFIANVCHGETSSGTALSTTHNVNSY